MIDKMADKYKLTGEGWFRIKNRGFCIKVDQKLPEIGLWNPDQLIDEYVSINGEDFIVAGVEKFMIGGVSPEHPYSLDFCVMVKEKGRE